MSVVRIFLLQLDISADIFSGFYQFRQVNASHPGCVMFESLSLDLLVTASNFASVMLFFTIQ
jgi:hypothetical protein